MKKILIIVALFFLSALVFKTDAEEIKDKDFEQFFHGFQNDLKSSKGSGGTIINNINWDYIKQKYKSDVYYDEWSVDAFLDMLPHFVSLVEKNYNDICQMTSKNQYISPKKMWEIHYNNNNQYILRYAGDYYSDSLDCVFSKFNKEWKITSFEVAGFIETLPDNKINLSSDVYKFGKPENLGPNINSEYGEYCPIISPDGQTLYFRRDEHPGNYSTQNIWFSGLGNYGKFKEAQNIGSPLNTTEFNTAPRSITPDGNSMFVFFPEEAEGFPYHLTYKIDSSTWSYPEKIIIENFYNNSTSYSATYASNGRVLLHTEERNDGYGEHDIFVSFLKSDGNWTEPRNLGADINTSSDESAPFLASDGVTLYFSSAGHPGYGSNDIFVSRRLDDSWQRWTKPINIGPKINTSGYDSDFTIPARGDYAYYSSKGDLYRVKLPEKLRPKDVVLVYGKVFDKRTKKPIAAEIIYENPSTGEILGYAHSNSETGEYKITLPIKENYKFRAEAKGFMPVTEQKLDLTSARKYYTVKHDLYVVQLDNSQLDKGQIIRIKDIFFNTGESELLSKSHPELKRLVDFLKANPSMNIKILGHTDNVGKRSDNLTLSDKRAESVKSYIVSQGIDSDRITTKGYGPDKPISTNKTYEGRALNRRVEFQILSK